MTLDPVQEIIVRSLLELYAQVRSLQTQTAALAFTLVERGIITEDEWE
jgi:hypothetical protein